MQVRTKKKESHASSNWLALQKSSVRGSPSASTQVPSEGPRKRRKLSHTESAGLKSSPRTPCNTSRPSSNLSPTPANDDVNNADAQKSHEVDVLCQMVWGKSQHTHEQRQPGKYLAIDCEMVGIGVDGSESSLARVSLVNYHGVVQLDEYVKQREKVVDYRTRYSGIRDVDMVKARPFDEVQKRVAELLKDKIVIGHAVHNDLKALLLSHPRTHLRDTQLLAGKFKVVKSKYVALRNLVKQELGLTIQSGEHSSVVDARATMAVYRLHRDNWEKGLMKVKVTVRGKKHGQGQRHETLNGQKEVSRTLGKPGATTSKVESSKMGGANGRQWWTELGS